MDRRKVFDRFQLHDNSAFNKKIKAVSAIEFYFFVNYREAFLTVCS